MSTPSRAQVVLITGASSGLGEEMARQFAALGYDLALCARRTDRLAVLAKEIRSETGRRVEIAELDVTDGHAVSAVFHEFAKKFGSLHRVVVNAGIALGGSLGTGHADGNRATAVTNFVGSLSQAEAAVEIFRRQGNGHLVFISSMSALRGMQGSLTTYAATKAGLASIAEGLRTENIKGLKVSVIYPGYIHTEINAAVPRRTPFVVDTQKGVRSMVNAIEKRRTKAWVPAWPWVPLGLAFKILPVQILRKFT
jgi:short-subunit dehydrogenase